jgi:hypothetical protein
MSTQAVPNQGLDVTVTLSTGMSVLQNLCFAEKKG